MPPKGEAKSYLSETISSFSPWSSRAATPKPGTDQGKETGKDISSVTSEAAGSSGHDHRIDHRHRLNLKSYPKDCPPLVVQWYFASDVAKRKPNYAVTTSADIKNTATPKKWVAFSSKDSRAIESAFQQIPDEEDEHGNTEPISQIAPGKSATEARFGTDMEMSGQEPRSDNKPNTNLGTDISRKSSSTKVPVNEDYLFDVDIENRELAPVYWLGPVYETRRGTWFYIDGTTLRPCDENLALQLEEGYIKMSPWRRSNAGESSLAPEVPKSHKRSVSQSSPNVSEIESKPTDAGSNPEIAPQPLSSQTPPPTYRLFGAHMNSVVTYQDAATAWLMSDDFLSRMSSTMYQRFAGGAHLSGTKVVRGYSELTKKKTATEPKRTNPPTPGSANRSRATSAERSNDTSSKRRSLHASGASEVLVDNASHTKPEEDVQTSEPESAVQRLERQMSNLVSSTFIEDPEKQDEEARKLAEQEISDDYRDTPGDPQDREIEHLVLVTHGIGQRLGARFETFNFIHDVNEFRKTLKSIYSSSADLQRLNAELEQLPQNCRIQVLPICWRHLLDFPKQSLKHNRKEYDLADSSAEDDDKYPSLQNITVEGVPALRNIVSDLLLDILIYLTPAYKDHIAKIIVDECNRIHKLFKARNPKFEGKVSLVGHSLGSALFFDLLAEQADDRPAMEKSARSHNAEHTDLKLDFDVNSLFCLGSPIGLFQMLKGKTLEGRRNPNNVTLDGFPEGIEDPFAGSAYTRPSSMLKNEHQRSAVVSSPKCQQLYNIFHPTDPIAYRLEPLITPSMSTMKPQNLPYVKKSFLSAPMGYGITGIPSRVSQGVSSYISSFSSGLADKFIHRSLGLSPDDAAKLGQPMPSQTQPTITTTSPQSAAAGTNIVGGAVITPILNTVMATATDSNKRKAPQSVPENNLQEGQHPPTLLDSELETLYAGFQKRRKSHQENDASLRDFGESSVWADAEERGRKLRREEEKVRMLNSNGRVDYSIQEGAFDISFLGSIASHLAYWTDEDVCHFFISQLLSRQRIVGRSRSVRKSVS